MKNYFEEPKMEVMEIIDIIVTSPSGQVDNHESAYGPGNPESSDIGGGW